MRETARFYIAFFATLVVAAILWVFGLKDELTKIFVSTFVVLLLFVAKDIAAHVNKLPVSKYDVAADLIGIGIAFILLLIT